ncbi:Pectinesterase inhibitor 5 [Linum perenne]
MLLLLSTTSSARKDVVDKICKQTSDYPLCVDLLNADPRTSDANLVVMCDVVVKLALLKARDARDYFSRIEGTEVGPIVLKRVELCRKDYEIASIKMVGAYESEDSDDYSSLVQYAKDATYAARHCRHVLYKSTWQPQGNRTHVFTILSEAVASIGKSLTSI